MHQKHSTRFPSFVDLEKCFSQDPENPLQFNYLKSRSFVRVISVNIRLSYSNVSQFISSNFLRMRVLWANCWKEGGLCPIVPFKIKHRRFPQNLQSHAVLHSAFPITFL